MMFRVYQDNEIEKISEVYKNGGSLWFFERTDTNQIYSEKLFIGHNSSNYEPDQEIEWLDSITSFISLTATFLTEENAEKYKPHITEGGCRYCNNNSKIIPIQVREHQFIPHTQTP